MWVLCIFTAGIGVDHGVRQRSLLARDDLPPPQQGCGTPPIEVGVLGGSISWGAELEHRDAQRFSARLAARLHHATVHNRAMPSTGVAFPSFCIDEVLPEPVGVLVVEYNFNDAFGHDKISLNATNTTTEASLAMERLLRDVLLREKPPWLIIILAVCHLKWEKCENMHREVARHYADQDVVFISLERHGVRLPLTPWFNRTHHPTAAGHAEISRLLAAEIQHRVARSTPRPLRIECDKNEQPRFATLHYPSLPHPLLARPSWERAELPWHCLSCSYNSCNDLRPHTTTHFSLARVKSKSYDTDFGGKVGWTATERNSALSFILNSTRRGATVLLSMLCSYENVGSAIVRIRYLAGKAVEGDVLEEEQPWRAVGLRWGLRSSQQCVNLVGAAERDGPLQVELRVTSATTEHGRGLNQVKVFGVYWQ
ncbi:hypothetical protein AB1Y20_010640 [Prymnesium parvum]|uniref:SGNH hydrolase-type esterase domain-containing protein n=1 Tax=Prymnesium parvum TaxID=97485 RepID=A0AB34IPB5_PRYPA